MPKLYGTLAGFGQRAGILLSLAVTLHASFALAAPIKLLILGDSLTAGYGLPLQDGFQAQLLNALKSAGKDVVLIDGAVSGDTSADAAARLDWVLAGGKPDAAIVELGGNDGLRGLDPDEMQHNLSNILNVLSSDHVAVLLCGILAPPSYGMDYENRFVAVFGKLREKNFVLFDPFFLTGVFGVPALMQQDGIHPDARGVKYEVKRLLPLVLQLIAEVKSPA